MKHDYKVTCRTTDADRCWRYWTLAEDRWVLGEWRAKIDVSVAPPLAACVTQGAAWAVYSPGQGAGAGAGCADTIDAARTGADDALEAWIAAAELKAGRDNVLDSLDEIQKTLLRLEAERDRAIAERDAAIAHAIARDDFARSENEAATLCIRESAAMLRQRDEALGIAARTAAERDAAMARADRAEAAIGPMRTILLRIADGCDAAAEARTYERSTSAIADAVEDIPLTRAVGWAGIAEAIRAVTLAADAVAEEVRDAKTPQGDR